MGCFNHICKWLLDFTILSTMVSYSRDLEYKFYIYHWIVSSLCSPEMETSPSLSMTVVEVVTVISNHEYNTLFLRKNCAVTLFLGSLLRLYCFNFLGKLLQSQRSFTALNDGKCFSM